MNNNTIKQIAIKGILAVAVLGFTYGTQTPVANAADGLSPAIAVHKNKLLPTQFVKKDVYRTQPGESIFNKSEIEKRFSSSKMQSSKLGKRMPQSLSQAYTGGYNLKQHSSKAHLRF